MWKKIFEEQGAITISMPLLQLTDENIDQESIKQSILDIEKNDWLVFTSSNAVDFYFKHFNDKDLLAVKKCKIAVIGPTTQKAVEKYALPIDFISQEHNAKDLALTLPVNRSEKILLLQSKIAKPTLFNFLNQRNNHITILNIYDNEEIEYSCKDLKEILSNSINFITFASGSSFYRFFSLLQKCPLRLKKEQIICLGKDTTSTATLLGIQGYSVAKTPCVESMLELMNELAKINT